MAINNEGHELDLKPNPQGIYLPALRQNVPAIIVDNGDAIIVTAATITGTTLTVAYRQLVDGRIVPNSYSIVLAPNTPPTDYVFPLSRGIIFSMFAYVTGTISRGSTFCIVKIRYGSSQPMQTVLSDYVSSKYDPTYPGSNLLPPSYGNGLVLAVAVTGALPVTVNLTTAYGSFLRFTIRQMTLVVTSANLGAARNLIVTYQEQSTTVYNKVHSVAQAINTTVTYDTNDYTADGAAVNNGHLVFQVPTVILGASNGAGNDNLIVDFVSGRQAGDNVTGTALIEMIMDF